MTKLVTPTRSARPAIGLALALTLGAVGCGAKAPGEVHKDAEVDADAAYDGDAPGVARCCPINPNPPSDRGCGLWGGSSRDGCPSQCTLQGCFRDYILGTDDQACPVWIAQLVVAAPLGAMCPSDASAN